MEEIAKRTSIDFRFDILDPEFLTMMARIAHLGAEKDGDFNWKKSRLEGNKEPINLIYIHLMYYQSGIPNYYPQLSSEGIKVHLASIAFNAMIEYWYECNKEPKKVGICLADSPSRYYVCSLCKNHTGKHEAYKDHDTSSELLLTWEI